MWTAFYLYRPTSMPVWSVYSIGQNVYIVFQYFSQQIPCIQHAKQTTKKGRKASEEQKDLHKMTVSVCHVSHTNNNQIIHCLPRLHEILSLPLSLSLADRFPVKHKCYLGFYPVSAGGTFGRKGQYLTHNSTLQIIARNYM